MPKSLAKAGMIFAGVLVSLVIINSVPQLRALAKQA